MPKMSAAVNGPVVVCGTAGFLPFFSLPVAAEAAPRGVERDLAWPATPSLILVAWSAALEMLPKARLAADPCLAFPRAGNRILQRPASLLRRFPVYISVLEILSFRSIL